MEVDRRRRARSPLATSSGSTSVSDRAFIRTGRTAHFFAYGTLMCEDILLAATGCRFTGVRGVLRDYERRTIRGEVYPGIVVTPGKVVEGLVYSDLPEVTWRCLDTFEGEMYQRRSSRWNWKTAPPERRKLTSLDLNSSTDSARAHGFWRSSLCLGGKDSTRSTRDSRP